MAELARERGIVVVIVVHTRKSAGGNADERAQGSRAFIRVACCVQHLIWHPTEEGVRLLLPGKSNNATKTEGMAFKVDGKPAAVVWNGEPIDMTADGRLSPARRARRPRRRQTRPRPGEVRCR